MKVTHFCICSSTQQNSLNIHHMANIRWSVLGTIKMWYTVWFLPEVRF